MKCDLKRKTSLKSEKIIHRAILKGERKRERERAGMLR